MHPPQMLWWGLDSREGHDLRLSLKRPGVYEMPHTDFGADPFHVPQTRYRWLQRTFVLPSRSTARDVSLGDFAFRNAHGPPPRRRLQDGRCWRRPIWGL
jgi:hypothetical protein